MIHLVSLILSSFAICQFPSPNGVPQNPAGSPGQTNSGQTGGQQGVQQGVQQGGQQMQGQSSGSLCDKYTQALFQQNTEENQLKLLTALVNTVVIGNFSEMKTGEAVPGILARSEFKGAPVHLAPLFSGMYASTNVNGRPEKVNFLDGGGAEPLKQGKASNTPGSKQDLLLNHLYQVFGGLLGCSKQGGQIFRAYEGVKSMYETHKFMNINRLQLMFFEEQVGKAAVGLGVSKEDAEAVGKKLGETFNVQCSPPIKVAGLDGSQGFCNTWDCVSANPRQCPADFGKATAEGSMQASFMVEKAGDLRKSLGITSILVFAIFSLL